jgi:hypothetical protein
MIIVRCENLHLTFFNANHFLIYELFINKLEEQTKVINSTKSHYNTAIHSSFSCTVSSLHDQHRSFKSISYP